MIKSRYGKAITLDGGIISVEKTTGDIHKSDINYYFRKQAGISGGGLWDLTSSPNYTISDDPLKFTSAIGVSSSATITSNIEYEASNYFHLIYNFEYKPTSSLAVPAFPASIISKDNLLTDYLFVEFVASDISGDKLSITVNTPIGLISFDEPVFSRSLKIRISYTPGQYILGLDGYLTFGVYENGAWREFSDPANPYIPWNPALTQKFSLTMNEPLGQSSEVTLGGFVFYPVLTCPYSKTLCDFPLPERSTKNEVFYHTNPKFAGDFEGLIYGVGSNWANSEAMSIKVLDKYFADSELCFVHSQINQFYTDLTQGLSCPDFSKEVFALGNLRAENTCICDGSTPSTAPVFIKTVKSGVMSKFGLKDRYPEILLEDVLGNQYGQDFDFKSIYRTGYLESNESGLNSLRCLVLDDGNRLFYGTQIDEFVLPRDVFIRWETSLNGVEGFPVPSLERWLETDGSGQIDYQAYASGTYNIATDSEMRYRLTPGRYSFKFNKGMDLLFADTNLEVSVYDGIDDSGNKLVEWPMLRPTFASSTNELKFEIKNHRANLYGFLHNVCDGTLSRFDGVGDEVNVISDSIGAIQVSDNEVALFFQSHQSGSLVDNRFDFLFYRILNLSTMALSNVGLVNFPIVDTNGDQYIYSFDCFKDENGQMTFLVGFGQERLRDGTLVGSATNGGVNTSVPAYDYKNRYAPFQLTWEPYVLSGVYVFHAQIQDFDWDGSDINIKSDLLTNIPIKSIEQLSMALKLYPYTVDSEDVPVYGDGQLGLAFAAPGQIRANYNSDFGRAVVSVIDFENRLGDIIVGKDDRWDEACYPALFNHSYRTIFEYDKWAKIESLTACFGQDGAIYGIGTTRALDRYSLTGDDILPSTEMFVTNTDMITDGRPSYLLYLRGAYGYDTWQDIDVYQPKYQLQKYPLLADTDCLQTLEFEKYNSGTASYDSLGSLIVQSALMPKKVDITLDKNNLVLAKQGILGAHPTIYQNGEIDVFPFSSNLEDTFKPGTTTIVGGASGTGWENGNVVDAGFRTLLKNDVTASYISRNLDMDSINSGKAVKNGNGYRFSARLMMSPSGGAPSFTGGRGEMLSRAVCGVYGGSLNAIPPAYSEMRARFSFLGDEVEMEVYDVNLGTWNYLGALVISTNEIYDFHIITRSAGIDGEDAINKGQVTFIVKKWGQPTSTAIGGVVPYFESSNVFIRTYSLDNVAIENAGITEDSTFDIRFPANALGDPLDRISVYDLGWGILKPDLDVLKPLSSVKDLGSFFNVVPQRRSGKIWRDFNDSYVFEQQDPSNSPFRVIAPDNNMLTPKFYYNNGFCFRMFGSKSFFGDNISLNREYLNDVGNIISKDIHSSWGSQSDEIEFLIWADASDSQLNEFDIDCVILNGANFRNFEVVYKDAIEDPWIVEGSYSNTVTSAHKYTTESFGTTDTSIDLTYADFGIDKFVDSPHYVYIDALTRPLKIVQTLDSKLQCKAQTVGSIFSDTIEIFSSRMSHKLSNIKARFVGIRITDQMTYDGYYKLKVLDFGRLSKIPYPCSPTDIKKMDNSFTSNILYIVDESAISKNYKNIQRSYDIKYDLISNLAAVRMEAVLKNTASKKNGVWILENSDNEPYKVFYTIIDGSPSRSVIFDEEDGKHFEISATFRSIE